MSRRSYRQFCGLARALDVIGDRWSLLIVRELLVRPAGRYGELLEGLPGIATNLLAERLRTLEASGVIERGVRADASGVTYALTPWGAQLREPVEAVIRWSTPLMMPGRGTDSFAGHWLAVSLRALLGQKKSDSPAAVGFEVEGTTVIVCVDKDGRTVTLGPNEHCDAILQAEPHVVLGLAAGALSVEEAIAAGSLQGDRRSLLSVLGESPGAHDEA